MVLFLSTAMTQVFRDQHDSQRDRQPVSLPAHALLLCLLLGSRCFLLLLFCLSAFLQEKIKIKTTLGAKKTGQPIYIQSPSLSVCVVYISVCVCIMSEVQSVYLCLFFVQDGSLHVGLYLHVYKLNSCDCVCVCV